MDYSPDGHFLIIGGRRWRATDPDIPDDRAQILRDHLMRARRDVGAAKKATDAAAEQEARSRVQEAKVALGERGTPWWEQTLPERRQRWMSGPAS